LQIISFHLIAKREATVQMNIKHVTLIIAVTIATYGLIPALVGGSITFIKEVVYLLRGLPA
jgi:hypothetical protein